MAFQGNAFALLEGDDGENLVARVLTAAVPSSAVDKRSRNHKKPQASSHSSLQSSSAPQQFPLDHEKGRQNINGVQRQNRNGVERQNSRNGSFDRQSRNTVNVYNRDGAQRHNRNGGFDRQSRNSVNGYNRDDVERHNRNGAKANAGPENGYQQNNWGGPVYKRSNGYKHNERPSNGLKLSEASSNGHQKKEEARHNQRPSNVLKRSEASSNCHQKKEATNGDRNGHQKKEAANGDSNGHQKEEPTEEDGWQIVVRSNSHKQLYRRREINNGNRSEDKVFEDKHHDVESGNNGVSGDIVEKLNGNAIKDEKEEGIEGDETSSKEADSSKGKHETVLSKEEIERLEWEEKLAAKKREQELESKRMTLKQYEKQLEEKRKVLESLKTEERRVTLDKDFNSMHIVTKKNEEEANFLKLNSAASDKKKKKVANIKDDSNSQMVKKIVLRPPPTAGRGGRYPRRDDDRNGGSTGRPEGSGNDSDARVIVCKPARRPPSFKDAKQFPKLGLDGSSKGK